MFLFAVLWTAVAAAFLIIEAFVTMALLALQFIGWVLVKIAEARDYDDEWRTIHLADGRVLTVRRLT